MSSDAIRSGFVYICEEPTCQKKIITEKNVGEGMYKPHRDLQGMRCNKLMVRRDLSPTGRREEIERRWAKKRFMSKDYEPRAHKSRLANKRG